MTNRPKHLGRPKKFNKLTQISLALDEDLLNRINTAINKQSLKDNIHYTRLDLIRMWIVKSLDSEGL